MGLLLLILLGLAFGSFANVLIDRLPKGQNVLYGRSHCDYCGKTLRWYELIPVISFIFQRGRCLRCHKKLSFQYPLIELCTAMGFSYLYLMPFTSFQLLAAESLTFFSMLVIFVADVKYQIIPDSMVVIGLIGAVLTVGVRSENLLAGVGACLFFYLLYFFTRGRGLGFGDVKLGFLLGFLAGFPKIVIALYVAFLTGAALGVILILGGKKKLKSKIAFGPFLILGLLVALIWGNKLTYLFMKFL